MVPGNEAVLRAGLTDYTGLAAGTGDRQGYYSGVFLHKDHTVMDDYNIIPFFSSTMGRNLLIVNAQFVLFVAGDDVSGIGTLGDQSDILSRCLMGSLESWVKGHIGIFSIFRWVPFHLPDLGLIFLLQRLMQLETYIWKQKHQI
nr:hypothetical protein BaRGS_027099 [Batillaria attramentaria]